MVLGLISEPPEGHLVEDIEAALEIGVLMGKIPAPSKYVELSNEVKTRAVLDQLL